jgi:hypothetical protein
MRISQLTVAEAIANLRMRRLAMASATVSWEILIEWALAYRACGKAVETV